MQRLPAFGWDLRPFDREPVPGGIVGDITRPADLDAAMAGVEAVVHLAGMPTEAPWPAIRDANIEGTLQVFEAARRAGVPRVVYASSNHAVGFTPLADDLPADLPPRPDTLYGVSKVFGEALGRYYVDRYGMRVACLRIGTFEDRPVAPALAAQLALARRRRPAGRRRRCARPSLEYAIVWGISANTRRTWSLDAGRALGYEPHDDAEDHLAEIPDAAAASVRRLPRGRVHLRRVRHRRSFESIMKLSDEVASRCVTLAREVAAWIADEVDPAAAAELQALLDAGDDAELADRFAAPLTFGTAGLRGPLRAGPNGMNRAVVRRAAAGLAAWLTEHGHRGAPVVVGYDARHGSTDFARDSAAIFAAAGFDARLLPRVLPTPVLAFAVQHLARGGRGDGDRVAQPAAGQRLQGLRRRRRADRAADRRRDRGRDQGGRRRRRPSRSTTPA